ncbi:MAG: type II toxin-antitoxin system RelE/ParE family toxin [Candidatus Obscuribacterales bacterium]|nr:type II toxin-antitoxin system RelE/ParE family toxin [Candidatus Obscuribacterales bacterium]
MASPRKYKVYFEKGAQEELGHLDRSIRDQFREPVQRLKESPAQGSSRIRNAQAAYPIYRRRIGDYRMFFLIDSKKRQVVVLAIRKRDSDTYDIDNLRQITGRYSGPHKTQP